MKKVSLLQWISGIVLGLTLTCAVFALDFSNVIINKKYYITQNEKYGVADKLELYSGEDYLHLYSAMIDGYMGNDMENVTLELETYGDMVATPIESINGHNYEYNVEIPEKSSYTAELLKNEAEGETRFRLDITVKGEQSNTAKVENIASTVVIADEEVEIPVKAYLLNEESKTELDGESTIQCDTQNALLFVLQNEVIDDFTELKSVSLTFSLSRTDTDEIKTETKSKAFYLYGAYTEKESAERFTNKTAQAFSSDDIKAIEGLGKTTRLLKIIAYCLVAIGIALVVITVKKQGRFSFAPIGFISAAMTILALATVSIICVTYPIEDGISLLIGNGTHGGFVDTLVSAEFIEDLANGVRRFYYFISLIPFGISYLLIRLSYKKTSDVNDDYLYQ